MRDSVADDGKKCKKYLARRFFLSHHSVMLHADSSSRLVRKKQIASDFMVSARTVDAWVARRLIPYVKVSPRLNLFDPLAVRAALESRFGVKVREDR